MQYVITFNNDANTSYIANAKTEQGAKREATQCLRGHDSVSVAEQDSEQYEAYGNVWSRTLDTNWQID